MGDKEEDKKKKTPMAPAKSGKRRKKKGPAASVKIPVIFPTSKCKLRLLKLERVKDFLLMEQEFIQNQEIRRPREEQNEVRVNTNYCCDWVFIFAYSKAMMCNIPLCPSFPFSVSHAINVFLKIQVGSFLSRSLHMYL